MTIRTTSRQAGPFAAGQTSLPFTFKVFAPGDVLVRQRGADGVVKTLERVTQYTVLLNSDQEAQPGGVVTLLAVVPGATHTVTTGMPALQLLDWRGAGTLHPDAITQGFDRLTILAQQMADGENSEAAGHAAAAAASAAIAQQLYNQMVAQLPLRVAVLGDSLASQFPLLGDCWPSLWRDRMQALGFRVEMHNCAVGGHTFWRTNTRDTHGGMTALQKAVAANPDVVIVALGLNDTITRSATVVGTSSGLDDRTIDQVKADAASLFNTLRTALPNATLVYASELCHDSQHYDALGTMHNRALLPVFMKLRGTGTLLDGMYCQEMLGDAVDSAPYAHWLSLDAHIKALPTVSGWFTMNVWRVARLGGCGVDGIHVKSAGAHLLASYAEKAALGGLPVLAARMPGTQQGLFAPWSDPDAFFTGLLASAGGQWVEVAGPAYFEEFVIKHWGDARACNPASWYLPSGCLPKPLPPVWARDVDVTVSMQLIGSWPRQPVLVSYNGGAFEASGLDTDARGCAFMVRNGAFMNAGTATIRYKVYNEVYGPFEHQVLVATANKSPVSLDLAPVAATMSGTDRLPVLQAGVARSATLEQVRTWATDVSLNTASSGIAGVEEFVVRTGGGQYRASVAQLRSWLTGQVNTWVGRQTLQGDPEGVPLRVRANDSSAVFVNVLNTAGSVNFGVIGSGDAYMGGAAGKSLLIAGHTTTLISTWTKLGDAAPSIKQKKLTTNSTSTSGGGVVSIAHGLTASKLLAVEALLALADGTRVPTAYTNAAGYEYHVTVDNANVNILSKSGNSANIASRPVTLLLTYEM